MKLPAPPPMTAEEIVGHIRDHWVQNIGADWGEAQERAELGFKHLLQTRSIREWGFDSLGNTLYETHRPTISETIVYVLIQKKEE